MAAATGRSGPGLHRFLGAATELGPGDGRPVHSLPAEAKVVATVGFVVAVVATPAQAVPSFAVHLALAAGVVAVARIPARRLAARLAVELPFLAFAASLPFVGGGEKVSVAGLSLSVDGLWAAWAVAAKATLALVAVTVLSATTAVPDILRALQRLRLPATLVGVAALLARYLDVLVGEVRRMHIARLARGHDPRWLAQAGATASAAGALFLRSYERGERVHLAMLSRGFTGTLPLRSSAPAPAASWMAAIGPVALAAVATGWGWLG